MLEPEPERVLEWADSVDSEACSELELEELVEQVPEPVLAQVLELRLALQPLLVSATKSSSQSGTSSCNR